MAATKLIEATGTTAASPEQVFALLGDSASWPEWTPIDSAEIVEPGGADGIGEVREFRNGRITVREEIVERVPGKLLIYVLLSGLPVRDYRARITLEPDGESTRIDWRTTFEPKLPGSGWLYRYALDRATRQFVAGLTEHAPRASAASL